MNKTNLARLKKLEFQSQRKQNPVYAIDDWDSEINTELPDWWPIDENGDDWSDV